MNTANLIQERIIIAESFKSTINWEGKTLSQRQKELARLIGMEGLGMVSLLFLIYFSGRTVFNPEFDIAHWQNTFVMVIMTMALTVRTPLSWIELQLQKHVIKIKNLNFEFNPSLNQKLKKQIDRLNNREYRLFLNWIPSILIMIGAIMQLLLINPFWDSFSYIVFIYCLILLFRIFFQFLSMKTNLKQVDSLIPSKEIENLESSLN